MRGLKCPDHVFTLDAIGPVYPDALRRPFTKAIDRPLRRRFRDCIDRFDLEV